MLDPHSFFGSDSMGPFGKQKPEIDRIDMRILAAAERGRQTITEVPARLGSSGSRPSG
jgi:hypothetical protein